MPIQKILIVDDSKTIRMQVKDMLPKGNFEVLEAADGLEGLDVITQERPNLILLDFFMPRMNGWEVVQKLHDHPKLHVIPVVMMSGRREDVEKTVPELFTYFEFLAKPFETEVLIRAIRSASGKAKQRLQLPQARVEPAIAAPLQEKIAPSEQPARSSADLREAVSTSNEASAIATLTLQVEQLQQQNHQLTTELENLKKQMAQLVKVVRQRLSATN